MRNQVNARRHVGLEASERRLLGGIADGHQIPHRRMEAGDRAQPDLGKDDGRHETE